ncbi:glycosyltransferase [Rickettsiales endosymbiont of Peranema trichophorum]|uniref:glycosyltransferase family 4 protein n=1 Tax=Rickettsiales endosymbiont of Peranema trichophorum TaxID=2486577 RepID=UPI0010235A61|nr:glycosyltransferase family 4 protein [Rickettsiales endosymbiont of Peranema trichophorum]RZI46781.1 glycosyltransferase [Rickettsiales endosymbiont of Peranema trichophorum]
MSLRVLQVLPRLSSGGVERGTLEIAKALVEDGHVAFVASSGGTLVDELRNNGGVHVLLPLHLKNPLSIFLNIFHICRIIKLHSINLIHARSRAPAWSAYFASKITGVPFVTTVHGAYGVSNRFKKLYNAVMLKGIKTIVVSKFILNYVVQNYSVNSRKLVLINRGVDIKYFNPQNVSQERILDIHNKIGICNNQSKVILLPGRFTRLKGHLYLLDMLSILQKRHTNNIDWTCIMVGDALGDHNTYVSEIKDALRSYHLEHRVKIVTTAIKDMPALYMVADIVMVPSIKPEAFGRTIIEGQAMGKVVVATTLGGVTEDAIHHGTSGFHIPVNDPLAAASILHEALLLNPKQPLEIGRVAMENVKLQYSLESMSRKTLDVYTGIHQ